MNTSRRTVAEIAAEVHRKSAAFEASAGREIDAHGIAIAKRKCGGVVSLTKSTRPGVVWQVTLWDESGEPTGHVDAQFFSVACGLMVDHAGYADLVSR